MIGFLPYSGESPGKKAKVLIFSPALLPHSFTRLLSLLGGGHPCIKPVQSMYVFNEKFFYLTAILMRSPNNRGNKVPTNHLLSPNKASSARTGLYSVELLGKGSHGNPQTTPSVAKTSGLLSTN